MIACQTCAAPLTGRQRRFCSQRCKNADTNHRHQDYAAQRDRGADRKRLLVDEAGGRCGACGYDKNYAALCFHHLREKSFALTVREFSNRSLKALRSEAAKCILLCHNCHMEVHHPGLARAPCAP